MAGRDTDTLSELLSIQYRELIHFKCTEVRQIYNDNIHMENQRFTKGTKGQKNIFHRKKHAVEARKYPIVSRISFALDILSDI